MIVYFPLLFIMTLLGSFAALFLKKASGKENLISILKNINLYIGGCLYLLSAILNIWILRYVDYSIVLPSTSLTYVWTLFLSSVVLREKITRRKFLGVGFLLLGAVCVSL